MAKKLSGLPNGMTSKLDVVKALLARGLSSPTEIAKACKAEHGIEIVPSYVSIIKNTLKKGKKEKKKVVVKGKTIVRASATLKANGAASGDLSLENLALRFALKAGGVEAAVAALEKLA